MAFAIRDELKMVSGRRFERGVREVIVGKKAAQQFAGLSVGSQIGFRDSNWTVVGIFETGGDVHESEIWADAETTMSAFRRTDYQSVTATLADGSDAGFTAFRDLVSRDPRFSLSVFREPEYYAKQAKVLSNLINILGYTVAAFMAIGAMFGALNCIYSAIASRQSRSPHCYIGRWDIVVSVMVEALLPSPIRWAAGGALAYLLRRFRHPPSMFLRRWRSISGNASLLVQGLLGADHRRAGGYCQPARRAAASNRGVAAAGQPGLVFEKA